MTKSILRLRDFILLMAGIITTVCCLIWHTTVTNSEATPQIGMPALMGEKAVEYLKDQGLYSSLSEAMRAARYGVYETRHSLHAKPGEQFHADNPSQKYEAFFSTEQVRLSTREGEGRLEVGMKLKGVGYGESMLTVTPGKLQTKGNRIEIARSVVGGQRMGGSGRGSEDGDSVSNNGQRTTNNKQITEWYVNRSEGLEQGFTIERAPGEYHEGQPLRLKLELSGELRAELGSDGKALWLKDERGQKVMSYSKLVAYDAKRRELGSRMKVEEGDVWLEVEDHGAEYPIEIDPVFEQVKKLTASDGATNDFFGNSVSISGNTIVVGALGDDANRGAAYVFERNQGGADQWGEVKKISASDGAPGDSFGNSVSISGDAIVVGARRNDSDKGAAYVFERNQGGADQWGEVKKISASDGAPGDSFGNSVSISGDTIVITAVGDDSQRGSSYVFERNWGGEDNWGEVKKITASDGATGDQFGSLISISCDTIVVSAVVDDSSQGAAYVYERNQGGADQWGEVKKITASDGAPGDFFGSSLSISNDTIVVSLIVNDSFKGAAYVYERNRGGADNWGEIKKLTASDGQAEDRFGASVSISGDTIVVGARGDDSFKGSAYVYERNRGGADNWGEVKKLTASDGEAGDLFGASVSISGDTIVITANRDDTFKGSAYVFATDCDNWVERKKQTASDGEANDFFGNSVSISGDTIVVGSFGDDSFKGAAYVFERNKNGADQWGEVKKLTAPDGAVGDQFGFSVSMSGDTIVIGSFFDDDNGNSSGSAYVYERNQGGADQWGEVKKITASDGAASDLFGFSVSISCDTLVVGAREDDSGKGAAYVFERNRGGADNWGEVEKLTASDGATDDRFGQRVSISGDTIVVGAFRDDTDKGAAYVYERNEGGADNWGEVKKLTASDGATDDRFGFSVSISCDTLVVGAIEDDTDKGAAYVYERNEGGEDNWGEVKKLTASDGAMNDLFGFSVSISCDTIVVAARDDDSAKGAAYVYERNEGGADNWGEVKKLTASDGATLDQFGFSISISGDTIVVGANLANTRKGSSYIFNCILDTEPPVIFCPSDIVAITARPGDTCVPVNFNVTATDNFPGVTVKCVENNTGQTITSGFCFSAATTCTTVTCTATDTSGNTAECSFKVSVYDVFLQDDSRKATRELVWNSRTGDYILCCDGVTICGRGHVTRKGSIFTLEDNANGRRVSGSLSTYRGNATLQGAGVNCTIQDRDIRDNVADCVSSSTCSANN